MNNMLRILAVSSRQHSNIAAFAGRQATAILSEFGGWYNGYRASDLARRMGSLADNVAVVSAGVADTSTSLMLKDMTGRWQKPGPRYMGGTARLGVTAFEAYNRLPRHYRYAISRGLADEAALRSVVDRARRMLALDAALAAREQQRLTMTENVGVVAGYRRVLRPELSKTGTCGLCVAASDQIYGVSDLMPIHPGCNCAVMPIVGDYDPGDFVNTRDLKRMYSMTDQSGEYGARTRTDYANVRVTIDEHGEYGPMLRHSDTKPKDLSEMVDASRDSREMQHQLNKAKVEQQIRDGMAQPDKTTENARELVTAYKRNLDA